jgi:hypothetical protein
MALSAVAMRFTDIIVPNAREKVNTTHDSVMVGHDSPHSHGVTAAYGKGGQKVVS